MFPDRLTIKDLPAGERPRERLLQCGPAALSDAELLAIFLRTGGRKETAIQLAEKILLNCGGLHQLPRQNVEDFLAIGGIGPAKAVSLLAAAELAKRLSCLRAELVNIKDPHDVAGLVMDEMRYYSQEHFRVLLLDTKNKVLEIEDVSVGSLNASLAHPREVFRPALRKACASIILVHNHPSGDPTPSDEDMQVTKRLCEAGKLLGVEVLDHVIIGDGCYTSLREKGLF